MQTRNVFLLLVEYGILLFPCAIINHVEEPNVLSRDSCFFCIKQRLPKPSQDLASYSTEIFGFAPPDNNF
jgi:hypothetical protein